MKRSCDVIELGSSAGVVSSFIAGNMDPQRKLVCIEANPKMLPYINGNLDTYAQYRTNCFLLNKAIVYGVDHVKFSIRDNHTSSSIARHADDQNNESIVQVEGITLGGILDFQGIDEFVLVSDIEGAEYELIKNDKAALAKCQQMIIELHSDEGGRFTVDSLVDDIKSLGFEQVGRDGHVFVFEPRSKYHE